ncbi:membrane dipeptidase [Apiospora rasikravindrae]|uniref:Membrane dipeptidase n=1 Tax=Apiospora rasikravindrae TaxID=990691 RepID=A0ABR1TDR9_9PEZI
MGIPFRVQYWGREYVILPTKYLQDLKGSNKDHLSFFKSIQDVFFLKYWVGDLFQTDRMVHMVKKGLNPHLNEATDLCLGETPDAFHDELGDCEGRRGEAFTSHPALDVCCGIAHRIASKIIVGDELCRDGAFRRASYAYFQGHAMTGYMLLLIPSRHLRRLLAWPLSYLQRRRQHTVLLLVSAYMRRRSEERIGWGDNAGDNRGSSSSSNHGATTTEDICVDWILKIKDDFPKSQNEDLYWQMSHELVHLLGASHTPTGITVTMMLWRVLHEPRYLQPLRDEAEQTVSRFGYTSKMIGHLPLMDNFISEVHRLYPMGCQRTITGKPFQLHDGATLPAGTRIAFPVELMLQDADAFQDAPRFDGYRFQRLAQEGARTDEGVNIWKASHSHSRNLMFGFGSHVCPGRFFAVRLIKIIFAHFLVEYDIESDWPEGGIPPGFQIEGSMIPHGTARISFKKRGLNWSRGKEDAEGAAETVN